MCSQGSSFLCRSAWVEKRHGLWKRLMDSQGGLEWWISTKFEDWSEANGGSGELIGLVLIHGRWKPLPQPPLTRIIHQNYSRGGRYTPLPLSYQWKQFPQSLRLRDVGKKKTGKCGNFSQVGDPPPLLPCLGIFSRFYHLLLGGLPCKKQ